MRSSLLYSLAASVAVASVTGALAGNESYVVNTIVNGAATGDTINVTSNGLYLLDVSDDANIGDNNTIAVEVVAAQSTNSTWSIDNLLLQGAATPEPASMSLLVMGVLAMYDAGCRRRRKTLVAEV